VFWRWDLMAPLILLLSGSQLLRRRLDDFVSGVAAVGVVLSGGLAVVVVVDFVLTLESAISSSTVKAAISSSTMKAATSAASQGELHYDCIQQEPCRWVARCLAWWVVDGQGVRGNSEYDAEQIVHRLLQRRQGFDARAGSRRPSGLSGCAARHALRWCQRAGAFPRRVRRVDAGTGGGVEHSCNARPDSARDLRGGVQTYVG